MINQMSTLGREGKGEVIMDWGGIAKFQWLTTQVREEGGTKMPKNLWTDVIDGPFLANNVLIIHQNVY